MDLTKHPAVLTIAGSDSGGGAGIQADLKTFSALGCYGMSVITAVTAQNTQSVLDIQKMEAHIVEKQIKAVLDDIGAEAVKIGMLFSTDIVQVVAKCLESYPLKNIVLDPVMVAKSGDKLLQDDAIFEMVNLLFPQSTIITPNIAEVHELTGIKVESEWDLEKAAKSLLEAGSNYVLIKGGHMNGDEANDYLFSADKGVSLIDKFKGKRYNTKNKHGTGCTYSSAIAACLAKGYSVNSAVGIAKKYINKAIEEGVNYQIGKGHGPVQHFFKGIDGLFDDV